MRFGFFDDAQREYIITRPDTPLPWINYLGSEEYFGLISNTAGGYSFFRDARLRRLTRYRYNNVPLDSGGRYVYLRDDASGEFWSPTWQPVRKDLDQYTCRHGMGYTIIRSEYKQVAAEVCYFVPLGQSLEIWKVTLTNQRDTAAQLSLFSLVEFALWDAQDDATNYQRNFNTGQVEVLDGVIYHKTEYRERRNHFAYFACSAPLAGFDTARDAFLGPYRGWDKPQVVEGGQSGDSVAHGWAPIGSHHVKAELKPGQSRTVIFLLGYHENPLDDKFDPPGSQTINKRTVRPVIDVFLQPENVEEAFTSLRDHWSGLLGKLQVQTPDLHTNRMVNIWNAYQCMITFNMSRSASYFESGIGRGMGFRDSNQDLLGFVHIIPERARQRILDLAATQLESGGAYHQYQPLTKRGNNDVGGNFNDDPAWLILGVSAYLKETGDWTILDEPVAYDNQPGSEKPLYDHLLRSFRYTLDRLGPHGLPLIGRADWNDCLNLNCFSDTPGQSFQTTTNKEGKTAESVFIAGLFVLAAQELAAIAAHKNLKAESALYAAAAERMAATVAEYGWDGAWFRRAYDDAGQPVGSKECAEGQIFIEPQGMCVMAGLGAEDGRALQALDSVREKLATPHGIVLNQPAFSHYYLNLGEISSYPEGYKENASIFCHTNPWIMIAEAKMGRGDQAYDYYMRINPSAREAISEIHRSEPYVYAQTIAGRDAPTHGEAKNSWLTGTAAWNFTAISQWILGIRPELDGLRIAPSMPESWSGFKATRIFRGVTVQIDVERRGPGNAVSLEVNGKPVEGSLVTLGAEKTLQVKAWVGTR
ncbi:MAG TPA: glycosyl transferase [Anaerolineaceae bacterium]|nr:glycosyl transferase [Anaerolineaceae bacterium]HPN50734.1 glycosyl transferase [Anaerolineaceae bacterium]